MCAVQEESFDRRLIGRIAAHASWANTSDRAARTRPARDQFLARFEREVDPDGELPENERRERALSARRSYMLSLARKSAQARRVTAQIRGEGRK
jgi:hypothetical protein